MATANEALLDRFLSHSIGLERYKARVVKEMMRELDSMDAELRVVLRNHLERIVAQGYRGAATEKRLRALLKDLGEIRKEAISKTTKALRKHLTDLSKFEAAWTLATIVDTMPIALSMTKPTAEVLHAAVFSKPMNGAVLGDWTSGIPAADLTRLDRAIRVGVVEGQTVQQITRNVMSGPVQGTRRGAEALARTAVNHTVTQAREATYEANADIIQNVRWISTLDGRTTMLCAGRDGSLYPINSGPRPPAHWACRSTTIPTMDGIKLVGDRPTITDTRTRQKREVDFRQQAKERYGSEWKSMTAKERNAAISGIRKKWANENIGATPKTTTYQDWLKRQSAAFQDDVLGPARGKLFRDGGLSVDRFTDNTGKMLTLDQLRARDAAAFQRAKL